MQRCNDIPSSTAFRPCRRPGSGAYTACSSLHGALMAIRLPSVAVLARLLGAAPAMASDLPAQDPVGFAARQAIPATLALNYSEDGRDARRTAVRNNYRPKVVFGGREVICMMRMEPGTSIAPSDSGDVRLDGNDTVALARGGVQSFG